jgi:hypothetical protein
VTTETTSRGPSPILMKLSPARMALVEIPVVASLPPNLANLARTSALESVAAAKPTSVSRATAHRKLDVGRAALLQAGLDRYLVRRHPVQGERQESIGTMLHRKSVAPRKGGSR